MVDKGKAVDHRQKTEVIKGKEVKIVKEVKKVCGDV